jgi:c-di-GMP-binding flagellar brake protein YcgR
MSDYGKIDKERAVELLKEVKQGKSFIKLNTINDDYQSVTLISEVLGPLRAAQVVVDVPADLAEYLREKPLSTLHVEFNGKDRLLYAFEARVAKNEPSGIWLDLPEEIRRIQRRRDFRLKAPLGTQLQVSAGEATIVLSVIDYSLGGLLGVAASGTRRTHVDPHLAKGRLVQNITLSFDGRPDMTVRILKATVVRVERHPVTGFYHYGMQFLEVERTEEKRLTEILYHMQRKYLRKRVMMEL